MKAIVENGYRLRVKYGEEEYSWPDSYNTLDQAGRDILQALKTVSESCTLCPTLGIYISVQHITDDDTEELALGVLNN
jgi:hypothetical protein